LDLRHVHEELERACHYWACWFVAPSFLKLNLLCCSCAFLVAAVQPIQPHPVEKQAQLRPD
jgi:hypothetical protein